ncbi:hypothetical protein NECAME_03197 [Necator americanus]|uniref:Uncharacterized protein n=1 Tax=Necator americanus TaxID=51031 RepID=W2T8J9_NECAM|nr:hypothetical protein NECAME_03197 [Necator americanus]ETN77297.1 hypothetical protein NECAME_03197 [Necator americanus]
MERLKAEVRKLRRLVKKKDLVIDMLLERIVKLRRLQRISEDSLTSGEDNNSTLNATTAAVDPALSFETSSVSSLSSTSAVACPIYPHSSDGRALSFTAVLPSQADMMSHTFVLRKEAKRRNRWLNKRGLTTGTSRVALLDANCKSFEASSETFVVPVSNQQQNNDTEQETEVRHVVIATSLNDKRTIARRVSEVPHTFASNGELSVIESFSSKSEENDPKWKPPLPPSLCLRVNRPEVIRRIESRQAAITAASALRHLVAEEKMAAARAVIQGKCSYERASNSLSIDPTLIRAFPNADIANLTKRRLRTTNTYKAEVSEERNRVDIAASKVIAHSFSESTRLAVLEGRASLRR